MTPGVFNYEDHVLGDTILRKQFDINIDLTAAIVVVIFSNGIERINVQVTIADQINGVFFIESFKPSYSDVYDYDIKFTFPDGVERTYVKGKINILSNKPE